MWRPWIKYLMAGSAALILMTVPEKISANEPEADLAVNVVTDIEFASAEEQDVHVAEDADYVGKGSIVVGDGVTASFDDVKGTVEFYSDGGTLWEDWIDQSGIDKEKIESIRVASGTVYLPSDSSNIFSVIYMGDWTLASGLKEVDLSGFDTSNVVSMNGMFEYCSSLTKLDLGSFDTSNVTSMERMFHGCTSLTELNLGSFDTSDVTSIGGMFYDCSSLTELDLSSFDMSNVTDFGVFLVNVGGIVWDLSSDSPSGINVNVEYKEAFLDGCSSLLRFRTPKMNNTTFNLPVLMYDEAGNEYTELGILSESILLIGNNTVSTDNISDCTLQLSANSYIYDGKEKRPTVTVISGGTSLTQDTDYIVDYADNTNAGTATVKVTGTGSYKGEKSVTFTINKADAKLTFAKSMLTKKTTDAAFTNTLTKITDGTVKFKSSNTKVATVNSTSGLVTIKGAGTATITATATEGQNYKLGSAAYTLKIEKPAPTPTTPPANGFSDVQNPKHAYYNAIYWAADAGITKGYPDGTFGIDKSCTRGEMIMFLWRYAGKPAPKTVSKSPFKDVSTTHTFYKAILWASQKGITKGYPDGTFGIIRNVSRGECMMFLWRLKGKPAPKAVAKSPFTDVATTNVFYKAILWGYQNKITTGYTSGEKKETFGIDENCSRGQIVTFLYRAK